MIESGKYTLKTLQSYLTNQAETKYSNKESLSLANLIVEEVLGYSSTDILADRETEINQEKADLLNEIIEKLKRGIPIQYVFGRSSFFDIPIHLNNHTLIPRQETEELVQLVIQENKDLVSPKILDIGTGSGCIALALKKEIPGSVVFALDNSLEALKVAKENAAQNRLNVSFFQHDIIHDAGLPGSYDLIISNPPYVLDSQKSEMHQNVLEHEPHSALFVGDDKALIFYECIVELAIRHLNHKGKVYFEINELKGDSVRTLLTESGFQDVRILKDLNGKDRFATGCCLK